MNWHVASRGSEPVLENQKSIMIARTIVVLMGKEVPLRRSSEGKGSGKGEERKKQMILSRK